MAAFQPHGEGLSASKASWQVSWLYLPEKPLLAVAWLQRQSSCQYKALQAVSMKYYSGTLSPWPDKFYFNLVSLKKFEVFLSTLREIPFFPFVNKAELVWSRGRVCSSLGGVSDTRLQTLVLSTRLPDSCLLLPFKSGVRTGRTTGGDPICATTCLEGTALTVQRLPGFLPM